ncbi:GNAT family N-acetyltransferase [Porphyrobacter sp. LM 6]|uniref:GNAT family N-acetyltransferase n=1 Tax=Porphyrobacter sp. LM 6 TaxID=1896196 RepID=UPI000863C10F|nr:GNAT family N-acetyltransferase [Porphyrobacter sp. LM 6]AOL93490.1 Acetyltransferase (GNAT) family protein [Porphyrobacter sp. LM 6]
MIATATLSSGLTIGLADYTDQRDAADVVALLDAYARDPMGGGEPLAEDVKARLAGDLAANPHAFSLIARLDDRAVGLANCFMGYSTFAAAPLVNIHDLAVLPDTRGAGIGKALMAAIEAEALKRGACKITLEVLSGNPARHLYAREGYGDYQLDPETGHALFWQKRLK